MTDITPATPRSLRELRPGGDGLTGCLVIAEVAQAHDGSLGTAHAFVDAAADAEVDAIKFQTHIAAAESTPSEPWRVRFSPQDETRYDYWKRMEFSPAQWQGLADHARDRGLLFLSSPFSAQAVELLEAVGMPVWKIASGEVTNTALLRQVAATGGHVLLSSGMSTMSELDAATELLRDAGVGFTVLQCASSYPSTPERVGLNMLDVYRRRYGCPVGISDHSATIYPALAAVALGASVVEVHLTLAREMFGPDVSSSLTPAEMKSLSAGVRFIDTMLAHPVEKDDVAVEMAEMRRLFTRSVVAGGDLAAGHVLREGDLVLKKPGSGIPGDELPSLIGRRLRVAVAADSLLAESDLEASS